MTSVNSLGLYKETFARLAGVIGFNYALQAAFATPAILLQTEKYYDLAGSIGFLSATVLSAYYPTLKPYIPILNRFGLTTSGGLAGGLGGSVVQKGLDAVGKAGVQAQGWAAPWKVLGSRQLVLSLMVGIWAGRLGSFLAQRIAKAGSDSRFDEIKKNPLVFAGAWAGQATWITIAGLPVWLINSIPARAQTGFGKSPLDWIGLGVWLGGLGLEVVADRQKSAWRQDKNDKKHDEKFIKSGVWSWSRHPNYVGEVTLWSGLAILSTSTLFNPSIRSALPAWLPYTIFLSPIFEYLLLTKASGVPLLEKSAEEKWGKDEAWREYKRKVPVMFAMPGNNLEK